jgi:ketosteroid isomerase-like protein
VVADEVVALLQDAVDAFNRRDIHALAQLTTDDFEFVPYLATLIERGTYRGHEGWIKYFREADAAWRGIRARLDDVQEVGGGLFRGSGEITGEGRASGLEVQIPLFWVVEIRDGRVARMHAFDDEADALEAVTASQRSGA